MCDACEHQQAEGPEPALQAAHVLVDGGRQLRVRPGEAHEGPLPPWQREHSKDAEDECRVAHATQPHLDEPHAVEALQHRRDQPEQRYAECVVQHSNETDEREQPSQEPIGHIAPDNVQPSTRQDCARVIA